LVPATSLEFSAPFKRWLRWVCALAALALLALPACTTAATSGPPPVYVMRHLNTPQGQRDPDLLPEGQRAARALAGRLGHAGLRAIYVSDFKRTRQSAAPLAARLHLTPIVYDPADTPGLIARVRAGPQPALIVGHSDTVPDIIEALGGTRPAPLVHADFGDLWWIGPAGTTVRTRIED
jgi:phosphohistidine phosphatase SixA